MLLHSEAMSSRLHQSELDDLSLETTVPTDLSFSPDEISDLPTTDDDRRRHEGGERREGPTFGAHRNTVQPSSTAARQILEKKHLQNDMQALKIELSQKSFMLDNMKVTLSLS